ncbi:DNA-3-methyladenine glycosylase family protein [Microcella indica]|uniref:DNA-3-methyladenine glycosylase family protein n=1 Tax=Microcella indica TaxID=2750620 RepID=UPI001FE51808|nr:DNA-3-methyladenine glycosylase 2 family protein [Microcella indica]
MTLRARGAEGAEAGAALDYCPEHPLDLASTLSPLQRGRGDPTSQWMPDGSVWRTQRTPRGAATLHLESRRVAPGKTVVRARAWGPGAEWSLAHVPALLGDGDDPESLDLAAAAARPVPGWPASAVAALASVQRRRPGVRLTRTELVLEAAVPAVLEQKVTGVEARRAWRRLLLQHGEVPPGPAPEGMRVVPTPEGWRSIPDHDWHRAGVGPQRMRTIRRVAAVASALDRTLDLGRGGPAVVAALTSIPGVGIWTAAEITQRAHGDPDAVSVGDAHLSHVVGHYVTGERTDDDGMLALLAPFSGQRQRVVRLITLSGVTGPRFGPKATIEDHRAR